MILVYLLDSLDISIQQKCTISHKALDRANRSGAIFGHRLATDTIEFRPPGLLVWLVYLSASFTGFERNFYACQGSHTKRLGFFMSTHPVLIRSNLTGEQLPPLNPILKAVHQAYPSRFRFHRRRPVSALPLQHLDTRSEWYWSGWH